MMRTTKSEIRRQSRISKPSEIDMQRLKSAISNLASEIERAIKDLKYISFYDSAIFYLY